MWATRLRGTTQHSRGRFLNQTHCLHGNGAVPPCRPPLIPASGCHPAPGPGRGGSPYGWADPSLQPWRRRRVEKRKKQEGTGGGDDEGWRGGKKRGNGRTKREGGRRKSRKTEEGDDGVAKEEEPLKRSRGRRRTIKHETLKERKKSSKKEKMWKIKLHTVINYENISSVPVNKTFTSSRLVLTCDFIRTFYWIINADRNAHYYTQLLAAALS